MLYFGDKIYLYMSFNTTYYWEYLFVIMVKVEKLDILAYLVYITRLLKSSSDRHTEPEFSATGAEFEVSRFVQFHFADLRVISEEKKC